MFIHLTLSQSLRGASVDNRKIGVDYVTQVQYAGFDMGQRWF